MLWLTEEENIHNLFYLLWATWAQRKKDQYKVIQKQTEHYIFHEESGLLQNIQIDDLI